MIRTEGDDDGGRARAKFRRNVRACRGNPLRTTTFAVLPSVCCVTTPYRLVALARASRSNARHGGHTHTHAHTRADRVSSNVPQSSAVRHLPQPTPKTYFTRRRLINADHYLHTYARRIKNENSIPNCLCKCWVYYFQIKMHGRIINKLPRQT